MDDPVGVLEIVECVEGRHRNLAANIFRYRTLDLLDQLVETRGHQLHADPHVTGGDEASQTHHDLAAVVGLEHNVHVHHYSLRLLRVTRSPHLLARNYLTSLLFKDKSNEYY